MRQYDKLIYTRRLIYAIVVIDLVGEIIRRFLSVFSPLWRQRCPIPNPKRILLIRTEQIGDLVLTTPAFRTVRENFPNAYIAVLVQSRTALLLKFNSDINEVISFPLPWCEREKHPIRIPNPFLRAIAAVQYHWRCLKVMFQVAHQLRRKHFDVAIDFGTHIYTILTMAIARIPVRIGDPRCGGRFLLTHWIIPDDTKHDVERCLDIVRILGAETLCPQLILNWSPEDEEYVAKLWTRLGLDESRPVIAIHPFSVEPSRCWRPENWAIVQILLLTISVQESFSSAQQPIKRLFPIFSEKCVTNQLASAENCHSCNLLLY
jgi:ADP-heptose:LPS heptosyltransferase